MAFTNIIHDSQHYCSSSSGDIRDGIMYGAAVINPPGGIDTQYCVIERVDTVTDTRKELRRFLAKDSKAFAISQGADPNKDNGKYGNVTLRLDGNDIYLVLEVRMNGVNKPKWIKLEGYAT